MAGADLSDVSATAFSTALGIFGFAVVLACLSSIEGPWGSLSESNEMLNWGVLESFTSMSVGVFACAVCWRVSVILFENDFM